MIFEKLFRRHFCFVLKVCLVRHVLLLLLYYYCHLVTRFFHTVIVIVTLELLYGFTSFYLYAARVRQLLF